MQQEILQEVDNLKFEVNEGRKKIMAEIERGRQTREESFEYLREEFEGLKN